MIKKTLIRLTLSLLRYFTTPSVLRWGFTSYSTRSCDHKKRRIYF